MLDERAILERLRQLFLGHFHVEVPASDTDLLASGTLDSLQLVTLLLLIEVHFGRRVAIEAINLEDLRSLSGLARLIASPAATAPGSGTAASHTRHHA
jgi:acyl carrier protein